jgi:hypothetical protein
MENNSVLKIKSETLLGQTSNQFTKYLNVIANLSDNKEL